MKVYDYEFVSEIMSNDCVSMGMSVTSLWVSSINGNRLV